MPPVTNVYDQTLAKQSFDLAKAWIEYDSDTNGALSAPQSPDLSSMSTLQIVAFVDKLLEETEGSPLKVDTIHAIETKNTCLQDITNAEIRCVWYILKLRSGDSSVLIGLKDFLSSQGRMKYLKPLYRALSRSPIPGAKEMASHIFNENKVYYHPIAISMCQNEVE
jgi:leukotriene-A4 hydrolase